MFIYIIVFIFSIIFYNLAVNEKAPIRFFFLFLAILIPSVLAGLRDDTVGADLGGYGVPVWDWAVSSKEYFEESDEMPLIEKGYLAINYFISRFTQDFNMYLFFHQLIVMTLITTFAYNLKNVYPKLTWVIVLCYFLYFYNEGLSMMRMTIALALSLWAFYLMERKRYVLFISLFVIIQLCHNSALFIWFVPLLFYSQKKLNNNKLLYILVAIMTAAIYVFFSDFLSNALVSGVLAEKYENYMDQEDQASHKIDLVFILVLYLYLIYAKKKYNVTVYCDKIMALLFLSFCLTLMGGVVEVANRIVYYFICYLMFKLLSVSESIKYRRQVVKVFVLALFVRYVYLVFTTQIAGTIPYKSKILDQIVCML